MKLNNTISELIQNEDILMQKAMKDVSYHTLNIQRYITRLEMDVVLTNNQKYIKDIKMDV